jgi:hypothetical protein
VVDLLSGEQLAEISRRDLSRLTVRCQRLLHDSDPARLLRSWLRTRCPRQALRANPVDLSDLLLDPRVKRSGISDPRSMMSAGFEAEAYVTPADVDGLRGDYLLTDIGPANVWLHVVDRPIARPVPLGLVLADLADHRGPREDARVLEMVAAIRPERCGSDRAVADAVRTRVRAAE